jgi:hypothetical protein
MTASELQAKYNRLISQKKAIDDQLKAVRAELRVRSKANPTGPKPPAEQ